jgi:hypothetical protein
MDYSMHIVKNFPKNYPFWRKVLANIIFFVGRVIIRNRKNLLTPGDFKKVKKKLRKGDVALVGGLRRLSSWFISGPVTHCLLYEGNETFIHAAVDGVEEVKLSEIFCEYDTLIILRMEDGKKSDFDKVVKFARQQLGKPYDYDFKYDTKKIYCTELLFMAFNKAGLNLEIFSPHQHLNIVTGVCNMKPIHPMKYLGGAFKIVFNSENLKIKNGTIEIKKKPVS